jgi:hypothetical protein
MALTSPQRKVSTDGGEKVPAYADPSAKELDAMAKMRAWLSRDGLEVPYTMTNEDAGGETRALLKFIRARPKSAEKAYEMLKNTLAWRAEKGVDCWLNEPIEEKHLRHVEKIPAYYAGFGKTGHPVYVEHTAAIPWPTILANMSTDEFLKSQVQTLEWQASVVYPEASRRAGEPITQVINVWDLKGLTMSGFTSDVRALVKKASALAQDNYPEGLYAAYIINAPKIFSFVWAVVKQFLDAKTVSKVHIYGSGTKMWEKLMDRLGPGTTLTKEMVCCKRADIGKAEAECGLQPAHGATQQWIKERLYGVEPTVGVSPGTIRRESSQKNMFDVFFDASEELPDAPLSPVVESKTLDRVYTATQSFSLTNDQPTTYDVSTSPDVVEVSKSKKCCC